MVASDGGAYSTAKFGVIAVMDCLRTELSAEGIGVTTLCPAGVNTNIHDHETMRPAAYRDSGLRGDDIERAKAQQAAREMLSKGADPRDVGKRVLDAIDEDAPMVFTDGGIAPVVTMRRDALMRAARLTAPVRKTLRPGRIVLAEPVGETRAGRALTALGCQVDVLDMKVVDTVMKEPERLGDPSDAAPLVLAIAPQSFRGLTFGRLDGASASGPSAMFHHHPRSRSRSYRVLRWRSIAVVLPTTALFADSARCADSVLGRSLVGLIEGLRAELLARRSAVTLVLTHEGEEEAVLAKRIHDALRDGPLYALPSSATDERVASVFDPWLEALARTRRTWLCPRSARWGRSTAWRRKT
ncbi:Dihydroanticapsin 7-dehydrogenase OS=Streptomyces griseorubiginosus OX=67304 GN=bacC_1 PE=3 SV=1 [Streptomyces griseorubiginosus]